METVEMTELRAYFFGNMYLSSIQQGIQAAHVVGNMATRYWGMEHNAGGMFHEWAENHETIILLNGGYAENIYDLNRFFDEGEHAYPYEMFNESKQALDGAVTCTGIILPEKIYEGAKVMRKLSKQSWQYTLFSDKRILRVYLGDNDEEKIKYTEWEVELMQRLNRFRLAI